jgi:hypothetical protein
VDGAGGLSEGMTHSSSTNGSYADLPGVRLWYTDSGGSGVPLILLHANTGSIIFLASPKRVIESSHLTGVAGDGAWRILTPDFSPVPSRTTFTR